MLGTVGLARYSSAATVGSGANAGSITVNPNGTLTVVNGGTYDGVEDTVYNVYNNSTGTLTGLTVAGKGISEFDGDGIDNYASATGGGLGYYGTIHDGPGYSGTNTGGPTGTYSLAGPYSVGTDYTGYSNNGDANVYTSFTPDTTGSGADTVIIQFGGGGIAAGNTGFISFEEPGGATDPNLNITVSTATPLPASASMGLVLLLGLGTFALLKKRHPAN